MGFPIFLIIFMWVFVICVALKRKYDLHFTFVEYMIIFAIVGLLATIAIPNFMKAKETAERNAGQKTQERK